MSQPTATATTDGFPLVHAVNVTKAFHGTEVLKGIDMDVQRGEVVMLLGPSGSARPPSCAASTSWRPSMGAGSGSTAT